MVFRRNTRRRNVRFKRNRGGKAAWRRMKSKRIRNRKQTYFYTRYADYGDVYCDGLNPTNGGYSFSLEDLPNYTEFTALYDMYKINAVKITFIPKVTVSTSTTSINNPDNYARFFSVIDYNSATASTTDQLRQYQTARFTRLLRTHKRYIYKPKLLTSISTSTTQWLSTSTANANYFGLIYSIEPTTATMTFGVEAKFYLSFRNVK
ncbi:capsid [uncultured virus]|uniref:Capsid n=1 Tax=uncultured virus TaxID=340016 RepID=A0A2K9LS35_9VIRU|nr:capsid [uncultured virus]